MNRPGVAAAAAVLVAAVLGGCAHPHQLGSAGGAVNSDPLGSAYRSTYTDAITRVVHLGRDGRTLTVLAVVGGCKTARLVSRETPARVELRIRIDFFEPAGAACPADVTLVAVHTTLEAALHGRTVTDAITGTVLAVTTHP